LKGASTIKKNSCLSVLLGIFLAAIWPAEARDIKRLMPIADALKK
jgi:hypothetical protein